MKKLVVLVDSSKENFNELRNIVEGYLPEFEDTTCDNGGVSDEDESDYINVLIDMFSKSNDDVMFIRFSGKENVARQVGDECSEMVIPISSKKDTHFCSFSRFDRGLLKLFL